MNNKMVLHSRWFPGKVNDKTFKKSFWLILGTFSPFSGIIKFFTKFCSYQFFSIMIKNRFAKLKKKTNARIPPNTSSKKMPAHTYGHALTHLRTQRQGLKTFVNHLTNTNWNLFTNKVFFKMAFLQ